MTVPERIYRLSEQQLSERYGLSPREIEVCQLFLNEPSLEAVAARAGLTLSSLRSVMRSIYEKTGHHSQAALMRLLMALALDTPDT